MLDSEKRSKMCVKTKSSSIFETFQLYLFLCLQFATKFILGVKQVFIVAVHVD